MNKTRLPDHRTKTKASLVSSLDGKASWPVDSAMHPSTSVSSPLGVYVRCMVNKYLVDIGNTDDTGSLYALVMREIESPLLHEVLQFHQGNQSRAATTLGMNRTTLRKKLISLGLI